MEPRERGYYAWAARWRVPLGFAAGIVYLVLARPTPAFLAAGSALALAGLALRAWAAGCLEKNERLAIGGPYARTRNPLYLGSSLMGAGFAIAGRSLIMAAVLAALMVFIYAPVIRREAEFLEGRFGGGYRGYAETVPLFLPRLGRGRVDAMGLTAKDYLWGLAFTYRAISAEGFQWSRYEKNHEYEAALGWAAGIAFLLLRMAHWIPGFP
jgi:protein-S-isoprenylcysteine O-methyltransferase Ste14